MITRYDFRDAPKLYRRPVVFGAMPPIPRTALDCAECGKPLPAFRPANMIAHQGACIEARRRRSAERSSRRRKARRRGLKVALRGD